MKFKKRDIGKTCLVRWDDSGIMQAMIVAIDDDKKEARVFSFATSTLDRITSDQVEKIGNFVLPPVFSL